MFYKLIEKKRNEWLASNDCTIKDLLKYIEQRGMMRDAQMEAIKTYLFLKLYCKNAPLWKLFSDGVFTDEQTVNTLKATARSMEILRTTPAAVALLEYARLHNKKGQNLSNELEEDLLDDAGAIDCIKAFQDLFYGITYPDYLFSLPMGAGKTYLMAAFIYLDLSFAIEEEDNPLYAHNFMILAPSGKKTSIMPSLKNIMEFDPTWVLPEDVASKVRRIIKFEILDEDSTARGSNMVRNPNAQKINQLISSYGDGSIQSDNILYKYEIALRIDELVDRGIVNVDVLALGIVVGTPGTGMGRNVHRGVEDALVKNYGRGIRIQGAD